jgi:hypothetical protein
MKSFIVAALLIWGAGCVVSPDIETAQAPAGSAASESTAAQPAASDAAAQSPTDPFTIRALRKSCYTPAGLCGLCSNTTVYDCVPLVPNPRFGVGADWDCFCCSGRTCI